MISCWLKRASFLLRIAIAMGAALALTTAVACKKEGDFEKAGKEMDKAMEDAGKKLEDLRK